MPKQTVLIGAVVAVVIAVLVGGYYMMSQKSSQTPGQTSTGTESQSNGEGVMKSSIKGLLGAGKNVMCTVKYDEASGEGTYYVSGDKMRVDYSMTSAGKTIDGHMISDGTYMYSWTSELGQGTKIKISAMEEMSAKSSPSSGSVDIDKEVDLDCSNWSVDESQFEVPTNVNFIDATESIQKIQEQTGKMQDSQKSACDAIGDATAKAACMQAIGGN